LLTGLDRTHGVRDIRGFIFRANDCVNAAGALDYDFKIGVIARSRSTLGSSPFCHGERFHVIVG